MEIEKVKISDLLEYKYNAKEHPEWQIEQIVNSIKQFGFNDPIAIDENNTIIEGHGRLYALQELGETEVDCIRLSHLDEEQKKAYILAHNKLTMNTDFDFDLLQLELDNIIDIDMSEFGFDEILEEEREEPEEQMYSDKISGLIYEPTQDEQPDIRSLYDDTKQTELLSRINSTPLPDEIKTFLQLASSRHVVFDYRNIAEYYAHAPKEVQELFEDNLLVIVDFEKAIELGAVKLTQELERMTQNDE